MRRRCAAVIAALLVFALPASEAQGSGNTYDVVFCSSANPLFGGEFDTTQAFSARRFCDDGSNAKAVKLESTDPAEEGRFARAFWSVEEPLGITGVSVEGHLRRSDGYQSKLFMADAQGESTGRVGAGGDEPADFRRFDWEGDPQSQFVAQLGCTDAGGCPVSPLAHTWVRDLRFTVADYADPEVVVEGSLFEGGWLRGERSFALSASDAGSGLARVQVSVNGEPVTLKDSACPRAIDSQTASGFSPCNTSNDLIGIASTASAPYVSGTNNVRACALDFASNTSCASHEILVDNEPPTAGFVTQDLADPELIRVRVEDTHSGLSNGAIFYRLQGTSEWRPLFTQSVGTGLQARVDSAAEVPGTYEFMATATDAAGNTNETFAREDGTPMTLEFPLRSKVELDAQIEPGGSTRTMVSYGRGARVEGRLFDAKGRPLVGEPVVVDEDFGEGALIDHRLRTVTTDERGRWTHKVPAGPTRSITASYAGDERYLDADVNAGRLSVETGARLGLSRTQVREGQATTFKGKIKRLGARIPAGGKVVQLQYRDPGSGRWFTVRNPFRTDSEGRYSLKYKFGTHYIVDVAIRFRLKVPGEQGWPYRATQTRGRRVIVNARP